MKTFSLGCNCGCLDPVVTEIDGGQGAIPIFKTRELAELAAIEVSDGNGTHPLVIEIEILKV